MTKFNLQKHIAFKQWLLETEPTLIETLVKSVTENKAQTWVKLLLVALDGNDLTNILYKYPLPLKTIIKLFQATLVVLPNKSSVLLESFCDIQNSIIAVADEIETKKQKILLESNETLSLSLPPLKILNLLALKITEALNTGGCVISQWNEEQNTLTVIAQQIRSHKDNPSRTWRTLNKPISIQQDFIGQRAMQTMRPVTAQAKQSSSSTTIWTKYGWQNVLAFPLQSQRKKLGLVEVYDRNITRTFNITDIQLGKVIASQITIVIERIYLQQYTQQLITEVNTLHNLSRQFISTLNLNQVLNYIVDTTRSLINCRACVLFLLDEKEEYLEIKAASGLKEQWKEMAKLAIGEGAAGQAISQRKTIYIPDTHQDSNFIFFDQTVRSLMVIPVIFEDQIIGAINLDEEHPNAFGEFQERLLTIVANQAAIAIKNATLSHQLTIEKQYNEAISHRMKDGLLVINYAGNIVNANPALGFILGMHPLEIIGQNIYNNHLAPRLKIICTPLTKKEQAGISAKKVILPGEPSFSLYILATVITDKHNNKLGEIRVIHNKTKLSNSISQSNKQSVQIIDIINQTILKLQGFAYKQKIQLVTELPPNLPLILGNVNQLEQIITTLIANVIKTTLTTNTITIKAAMYKNWVTIIITDIGSQFPIDKLEQIFSKYYHKEQTNLPISQIEYKIKSGNWEYTLLTELIEHHDGKLLNQIEPNKGNTYMLQLPIALRTES